MKVKCITQTLKQGVDNRKIIEWAKNSELEIAEGKTYVILAISRYLDALFYYIFGDESDNYPG